MMDQPVMEARRAAGKAGRRQKQEWGGGQYRQEYPQHPQRDAEPAGGQQQVAHR
ncbi:hypothetical protein D3C71_2229070 [compost metagenome]